MGYAFAMSACLVCKQICSYNPVKVPSMRDASGERQPICQECMTWANAKRAEMGLAPLPVHPDAYRACDEGEL